MRRSSEVDKEKTPREAKWEVSGEDERGKMEVRRSGSASAPEHSLSAEERDNCAPRWA